jgi:hypothetical protein
MVIEKPMKVTRKNNTNTISLTHAKRVTLAFLIMASFTLAIANIHFAEAQRVEFIIQFGTSGEENNALEVSVDPSSGDVYVVGPTSGTFPDQTSEGETDAFLAKFIDDDDDKRKKN